MHLHQQSQRQRYQRQQQQLHPFSQHHQTKREKSYLEIVKDLFIKNSHKNIMLLVFIQLARYFDCLHSVVIFFLV